MNILFVNCCIRGESIPAPWVCAGPPWRRSGPSIPTPPSRNSAWIRRSRPFHSDTLARRNALEHQKDFSDPMFRYAQQFAEAEIVVVGAPYWEYQFPALLRCYIEHISVNGVTFAYGEAPPPRTGERGAPVLHHHCRRPHSGPELRV